MNRGEEQKAVGDREASTSAASESQNVQIPFSSGNADTQSPQSQNLDLQPSPESQTSSESTDSSNREAAAVLDRVLDDLVMVASPLRRQRLKKEMTDNDYLVDEASSSSAQMDIAEKIEGEKEFACPNPILGNLAVEIGSEASNESTPTPSVVSSSASSVGIPPKRKRRKRGELPSIICTHADGEGVRCKQRAIFSFEFCIRHILQDPSAPYKRCEFVRKPRSKRETIGEQCTNAIRISGGDDTLCSTHLIMKGLREPKKKKKNPLVASGNGPTPEEELKKTEEAVKNILEGNILDMRVANQEKHTDLEVPIAKMGPNVKMIHGLTFDGRAAARFPMRSKVYGSTHTVEQKVHRPEPEQFRSRPEIPEPRQLARTIIQQEAINEEIMEVDEDEEGEEIFEDADMYGGNTHFEDYDDDEEEEDDEDEDMLMERLLQNQFGMNENRTEQPVQQPVQQPHPQFVQGCNTMNYNVPNNEPFYIYVDEADREAFAAEFDEDNLDLDRLIRVIQERQNAPVTNQIKYIPRYIEMEQESEEDSEEEDSDEESEDDVDSEEYGDDVLEVKYSEEELIDLLVKEMENEAEEWVDQKTKLPLSDREEVDAQESCLHEMIALDTMTLHKMLKDKGLDLPPQMLHNWRVNMCERMTNIHSGNIQEQALRDNPKLAKKLIRSGTVEAGAYTGNHIYKPLNSDALPVQGADPMTSSSARRTNEGMIRMDQRRQPRKMVGAYRMIPEVDDICRIMEDRDADRTDLFPLGLEPSDDEDDGDFVPFFESGIVPTYEDSHVIERYMLTRELAYEKSELAKKSAYGAKLMEAAMKFPNSTGQAMIHRNEQKGTEPYNVPPDGLRQCYFRTEEDGQRCPRTCLPYTNHCAHHMVCNVDQRMFTFCTHSMCRRAVNPVDCNMWNGKCERHREDREEMYGYEEEGEKAETQRVEENQTMREQERVEMVEEAVETQKNDEEEEKEKEETQMVDQIEPEEAIEEVKEDSEFEESGEESEAEESEDSEGSEESGEESEDDEHPENSRQDIDYFEEDSSSSEGDGAP